MFLLAFLSTAQVESRKEEIEQAREAKSKQLEPAVLTGAEKVLQEIKQKEVLERITAGVAGWRVRLGGLITGSGVALGPEYYRHGLLDGQLDFIASARVSTRHYQRYDVRAALPRLANDHVFTDAFAVYRNYPRIDYYGPGPHSSKTGRSNFRLEETSLGFGAGVKPIEHVRFGAQGAYMLVNAGPGTEERFASIDETYFPATTPGLDRQPNFWTGSSYLQFDYRDRPGGPRSGGNYVAQYSYYSDREFNRYSFQLIHLEAQQYIPFFNQRRVIALRAQSVLTDANRGQVVPFYLQPTLGGSNSLRGFRAFRFYDNNLILFNGEYRWEVFSGLDMALFYDTGKVFTKWHDWNVRHMEEDYGFGFRFNVRDSVFMRIDFGFSREGFAAWLKFDNVF